LGWVNDPDRACAGPIPDSLRLHDCRRGQEHGTCEEPSAFHPCFLFLLQEALPERLDLIGALRKRLVVHKPDGRYPPI
jgi:hypothetical protein